MPGLRPLIAFAFSFASFVCALGATPTELESCLARSDPSPHRDCLRVHLGEVELETALAAVEPLGDPALVLDALAWIRREGPAAGPIAPGRAARVLDLEGQALLRLERYEESAAAYDEALLLDDGTGRLSWVVPEGRSWSTPVDLGNGRLRRAARSLAAAGRAGEAAALEARVRLLEGLDRDSSARPAPRPGAAPLLAEPWFGRLPDLTIPLIGGGEFSTAEARGSVVILDFWATWCAPCLAELPRLEELYRAEKEHGLQAVAINTRESPQLAVPVAQELGLTMPIGIFTAELDDAFNVRSIPTVVIADRRGRLRGRWELYRPGFEDEIAGVTRRLLEATGDGPSIEAAEVLHGAGALVVDWMRETSAPVEGLLVLPRGAPEPGILASHGRSLALYRADGSTGRRWDGTPTAARLSRGPFAEDGSFILAGFRPGGSQLALFRLPSGDLEIWDAPAPVLDAALLRQPDGTSAFVVGTRDGLLLVDGDGSGRSLGRFGTVSGLGWAAAGAAQRLLVLSAEGGGTQLAWLDPELQTVDRTEGPEGGWRLVVDPDRPDRAGVAPPTVVAVAVGSFSGGALREAALATRSGQLLLVDLETGRVRFRAQWGEGPIAALAAGDVDGDGLDELVVAAGGSLALLRGGSRAAE